MRVLTGAFWISLIAGGILGVIAAHVRLINSPLQGRHWVVVLGSVAGALTGAVVFLGLGLAAAVIGYSIDGTGPSQPLGPTLLILLLLFLGFSFRRK